MSDHPYVIYVEDERPIRELVVQALRMSGFDIQGAGSGQQALDMMAERKPDLILLDLMMPNINGWDVYRTMKQDENLASIPVIIITARVPEQDKVIVEGLPPVEDYITKPFDVERLIRSVNTFL